MRDSLSIIIPAKNEQSSLPGVLDGIFSCCTPLEVIVVDDGSTDGTASAASREGVKVIRHPYSKGNGAAIKAGARAAKGKTLLFMDADGQHDPRDIPRLLEKLYEGYDLVVGARAKGSQASIGRGVANKVYNWLATYMTGHKVEDLTSGFRVARAKKFREFLSLLPNGFSYPTTSTMAFFRAGYSVTYEKIHASRREGKSHISPLKDGLRFLLIIFKIGTLYSPLKLFFPLSVLPLLLGLGYYAFTYMTVGRFTNMSALLFTTAILIFLMGLVSEQITQLMYKEVGSEDDGRDSGKGTESLK
ncbi:glycosyltransferase family 2 protein [Marinobacter pelagius]|uniref:Glycosyltransferase involved in cell wall bisynthesis n=1 Tax=Marinobacter pelagius TaxID=379482 RepID=A0A1I4UIP4_9GAMM|nr:glycosyltransferase family 2 protein [Marinobacter pelagius]SFM88761.1 Glycosyltransferase involved in cell wall bisynthesis [Marinobacter pelagius]